MAAPEHLPSPLRSLISGYGRTEPLPPYALLNAAYIAATTLGVANGLRRRGVPRARPSDLALLAVATFRLTRLVTKDKVTGFARSPFTRFVEEGDGAEVNEAPRGEGVQHAIGELLTCPFCFNQWAGTALAIAWLHAPRLTRLAAGMLGAISAADVLHVGWVKLEAM